MAAGRQMSADRLAGKIMRRRTVASCLRPAQHKAMAVADAGIQRAVVRMERRIEAGDQIGGLSGRNFSR